MLVVEPTGQRCCTATGTERRLRRRRCDDHIFKSIR